MRARDDLHDIDERIARFQTEIAPELSSATSFEAAARTFAREFYAAFGDFAILARVFAIVPFCRLSDVERERLGPHADETPVLTLFGTRGVEQAWNDRTASRGHRAIPLVSNAFIEAAPMIAKLLAELGGSVLAGRNGDWQFVQRTTESDGVFFVGDARTTTDRQGRHVIPAAEFVERYGIRTVFGFGGYTPDGGLVVVIVFCRKALLRTFATKFVPLIDLLREERIGLRSETLFAP